MGMDPMELDVGSLEELSVVLAEDERVREWLPRCAVAINDRVVSDRDMKLEDGDRVTLLPPVCGG